MTWTRSEMWTEATLPTAPVTLDKSESHILQHDSTHSHSELGSSQTLRPHRPSRLGAYGKQREKVLLSPNYLPKSRNESFYSIHLVRWWLTWFWTFVKTSVTEKDYVSLNIKLDSHISVTRSGFTADKWINQSDKTIHITYTDKTSGSLTPVLCVCVCVCGCCMCVRQILVYIHWL